MLKSNNHFGSGMFWLSQGLGWFSVSFLLGYWNVNMNGVSFDVAVMSSSAILILGVSLSFLYRQYMVKEGWLKLNLASLFPRILIGSVVFGTIFTLIIASTLDLFFETIQPIIQFPYLALLGFIFNSSLIFMLWSSIYLNYNYYKNYEKEEIKNLKLKATNQEVELQNLKSQLNPHFIFNAMNSIKALIEEDPSLAKNAITQLSSILRNSLLASKGQFVSISDEINIVKKYLSLEKIRYEERLNFSFNLDENALDYKIPPLIISTLVENSVKHGIELNKDGGLIKIDIIDEDDKILIKVTNPGVYKEGVIKGTGIGLSNTKKRLEILYNNKAHFEIKNTDQMSVVTTVSIPKTIKQ